MIKELHDIILTDKGDQISAFEIKVSESESCLLLTSLYFQESHAQTSERFDNAPGLVSVEGRRACELKSRGE